MSRICIKFTNKIVGLFSKRNWCELYPESRDLKTSIDATPDLITVSIDMGSFEFLSLRCLLAYAGNLPEYPLSQIFMFALTANKDWIHSGQFLSWIPVAINSSSDSVIITYMNVFTDERIAISLMDDILMYVVRYDRDMNVISIE